MEPVVFDQPTNDSHEAPSTEHVDRRGQSPQRPEEFDGFTLCTAMRDEMERVHRGLREPQVRKAFHEKWTDVCATDPRVNTEAGADAVAREMLGSMHERFDFYFDRQTKQTYDRERNGAETGIGVDTELVALICSAIRIPILQRFHRSIRLS